MEDLSAGDAPTMSHEHSWVNTDYGVNCTTCPEKIEAPKCPHEFKLDRVEETGQSHRKAILKCELCDHEQGVLTNKSDAEIEAEVNG